MNESSIHYLWSDAWLFLAVSLAVGNHPTASLASVITFADGIQHAIPTKEELDGALGRLQLAGFIRWSGDDVELLKPGQEFLARATQGVRSLLDRQDAIKAALHATPWSERHHPGTARAAEGEHVSNAQWAELMRPYVR